MIEKITPEELDGIKYYIDACLESEVERTVPVEYILRFWDKNKSKYLEKFFGDKLILSRNIEYNKDYDELYEDIDDNFSRWGKKTSEHVKAFLKAWQDAFRKYDIEGGKYLESFYAVNHLIGNSTLAKNHFDWHDCEIYFPEMKEPIKVFKNSHPMKIIRKLVGIYNIPYFDEFCLRHSQVLNQKKLKGELCISIHPLDYMTMSDNANDWTSCMSWEDAGQYRQGTVEMMNSSMVVVAYLKSSDDYYLNHNFTWNSKKWRELFIITPEAILNVKGYPYKNEFLTKTVLNWLKEIAEGIGFGTYSDIIKYDTAVEFNPGLYDYALEVYPRTGYMYNDFNINQFGVFTLDKNVFNGGTFRPNYSGESECMACGDGGYNTISFQHEGCLSCDHCYAPRFCGECGHYLNEDEGYWVDDELICEDCLNDSCYFDVVTEEYHLNNTGEVMICLATDDGTAYYPDIYTMVSQDTFNDLKDYYHFVTEDPKRYNTIYCITRDKITENGLKTLFFQNAINYYSKIPTDDELRKEYETYIMD